MNRYIFLLFKKPHLYFSWTIKAEDYSHALDKLHERDGDPPSEILLALIEKSPGIVVLHWSNNVDGIE